MNDVGQDYFTKSSADSVSVTPCRSGSDFDFASFGGSPVWGLTPRGTPNRTSTPSRRPSSVSLTDRFEDAGTRKSSPSLFRTQFCRRGTGLSTEDELNRVRNNPDYYDDQLDAACSRSSDDNSAGGGALIINLSMQPSHILTPPYFDPALAADLEGARQHAMGREDSSSSNHYAGDGQSIHLDRPSESVLLKFVEVQYQVIVKRPDSVKPILQGITGMVAPTEMLAMMGPSGSGKTTLLNVLSGRIPSSNIAISGEVTYNDRSSKHFKSRIGFVSQDDILYPHLTVRETLMYAALLRLPSQYTRQEKLERAEIVMEQLGLQMCADTVIGSPLLKGVSGGERKRVSIGHEILINPSLLFLDEPTSGLDSTTALRLMHVLKSIAQGGRTVVTTIHQPSSRMFHMFDKLILLSEGQQLYFGKAVEAVCYFESLGFRALVAMNPAEFLLDLASSNTYDMSIPEHLMKLTAGDEVFKLSPEFENRKGSRHVKQYLADAYQKAMKEMALDLSLSLPQQQQQHHNNKSWKIGNRQKEIWNTSWWQQFTILMVRGLKERRHEYLSPLRIIQVLATAVISGGLWWQSKLRSNEELQDQMGLLFFIAMFWGYLPLLIAVFTFPLERAVLAKERSSNMYRLSAYFVSRNVADLPLDMILPIAFLLILYFMAHLHYSLQAFFSTLLSLFLIIITAQGVGLLIGAAVMDVRKATILVSVLFIAFLLTGGFILQHLPAYIDWSKYLSFQYYAFRLVLKVQYSAEQRFDCKERINCGRIGGAPALHGLPLGGPAHEILILLMMSLGFRLLAYVALRQIRTALYP